MAWVFRSSQTKGATRLVMLALANEASRDGEVSAYARSYSHLARQANVNKSTVWRAIDEAVSLGELVVTRNGGGREKNDYQFAMMGDCEVQPVASRNRLRDATPEVATRNSSDCDTQPQGLRDAIPITPFLPVDARSEPVHSSAEVVRVDPFDEFWSAYPRKTAKLNARNAWTAKVVKAKVDPELVIAAAHRYAADPNRVDKFTAHPATWLNGGRWMDEQPLPARHGHEGRGGMVKNSERLAEMARRSAATR